MLPALAPLLPPCFDAALMLLRVVDYAT